MLRSHSADSLPRLTALSCWARASYSINDLFGWFNTEGTVSVPTNNNYVLDIPITINEEFNSVKASINEKVISNTLDIDFLRSFDIAILDPPRAGARVQFLSLSEAKNYVRNAIVSLLLGEDIVDKKTRPYGCSIKY